MLERPRDTRRRLSDRLSQAGSHWITSFLRLCEFGGLFVDMTIGTPMVIFCCFDCLLTVYDNWYTVGSLGRHVTISTPMVIFAVLTVFWLFLTISTLLVHCWYSLGRPVTIGTPIGHFCCFDCLLTVFDDWYTVGTVLVDLWRLVHQWSFLLFWLSFDLTLTT